MTREDSLRNQIIEYGKRLVEYRLIQSTWGNISVRLDDDHFLITPSGIDYFEISPDDIVKVKTEDFSYEGNLKPSSEMHLHGLIYKKRKDIMGIVHTHSSNLQVFASCNQPLKKEGKVIYPCSRYGVSSSKKLARNVAREFTDYLGVIIANHGFIAGGKDLESAFALAVAAEKEAGAILDDEN
jgi:L-fuculose-phosphate aldolase